MGILTEAATLQPPPPGDGKILGRATLASGGDGTFEGSYESDGFVVATLVNLKTKSSPNKFKGGEMREQLVWLFEIDGLESRGSIALYTSFSLHEKSHLPGLVASLGKPALKPEDPILAEMYAGAKLKVLVEMEASATTGKLYPRITKTKKLAA